MSLRVRLHGDPPVGEVTRDDAAVTGTAFVGWGGLLRVLAELAGEAPEDGEAPEP